MSEEGFLCLVTNLFDLFSFQNTALVELSGLFSPKIVKGKLLK